MRIGDALEPSATAQIRVHRVPLDWPWPNDGDLRHQVIHLHGLGAWERLLLRATLNLEDANGVRCAHSTPNFGDLLWQRVKIGPRANIACNKVQRICNCGEDAKTEQIELHQFERLNVVLVELQHRTRPVAGALHGG